MRRLTVLKSKIHRATVTEADLNYEGSISICPHLMQDADIRPYERVLVVNINNGNRFETYAIEGELHEIKINGAAARLCQPKDKVIIMCFCEVPEDELIGYYKPIILTLNETNDY